MENDMSVFKFTAKDGIQPFDDKEYQWRDGEDSEQLAMRTLGGITKSEVKSAIADFEFEGFVNEDMDKSFFFLGTSEGAFITVFIVSVNDYFEFMRKYVPLVNDISINTLLSETANLPYNKEKEYWGVTMTGHFAKNVRKLMQYVDFTWR